MAGCAVLALWDPGFQTLCTWQRCRQEGCTSWQHFPDAAQPSPPRWRRLTDTCETEPTLAYAARSCSTSCSFSASSRAAVALAAFGWEPRSMAAAAPKSPSRRWQVAPRSAARVYAALACQGLRHMLLQT